jgi:2-amino-4-hydroxy-6-hydroxymethyldihydropteridine diphosphokinase
MPEVFVGLGSNARPVHHLRLACEALAGLIDHPVFSAVYAGAAVGGGEPYLNMVAGGASGLPPQALQAALKDIEARAGRTRGTGEVTLDLDLLLYGDRIDRPLRLPRRDVLEYAFVLGPLADIAPALRHPLTGRTVAEHWRELQAAGGADGLTPLGALATLEGEQAASQAEVRS